MISNKELKKISDLAHLEICKREQESFKGQLGEIIDYVEKLNEVNTEDIVPTAYTVPMKNVLREDKVEESASREKYLANAPEKKDGQFVVPRIIGE